MAAATTIAATYTSHYLGSHPGLAPGAGAALTHGFSIAFYALAAVAAAAAILAALIVESHPKLPQEVEVPVQELALESAA